MLLNTPVRFAQRRPSDGRVFLLATLFLTTAGFGRVLGDPFYVALGAGPVQYFTSFFGEPVVLALGAYDHTTRRRLHPAYMDGGAPLMPPPSFRLFSLWKSLQMWDSMPEGRERFHTDDADLRR